MGESKKAGAYVGGVGNPLGFAAGGRPDEGNLNMSFHTSFGALTAQVRADKLESLAAVGGSHPDDERLSVDVWVKGKYVRSRNGSRRSETGLLYMGADWLHSPDMVLGLLGQVDWTMQRDPTANS